MAISDQFSVWLEVARSLFPEAGLAIAVVFVLYLARQGWKTREDWQLGPPWTEFTQYLKRFHREFGHLPSLGYGQQVAFYILGAHPALSKGHEAAEAYELDRLLQLICLEKRSLLITGHTATGKTTFLQSFAVRASLSEHRKLGLKKARIPFYLPLKLIDTSLPFVPAICKALLESGMPMKRRTVRRAIRTGRALFLFDDLDDVGEGEARADLWRWMAEGHIRAGNTTPFVIACKPETLLGGVALTFPYLTVTLRNYALLQFRSLRAVAESRMPATFRNPVEHDCEYLLVSPPSLPIVLRGAKKPVPHYYYHLAKYPVSNRLYRTFVEQAKHRPPAFWGEPAFAEDDLPVVGIDWSDAEAYCAWLTESWRIQNSKAKDAYVFRLPSEEEWEWAAGNGERLYPWGNEKPGPRHANFAQEFSSLNKVHAHPAGATPSGFMDMAGNVWEWTSTWSNSKKDERVVRGGAAFNDGEALQCTARHFHGRQVSRYIGLRVVRMPQE